jgi:hypothetical protein
MRTENQTTDDPIVEVSEKPKLQELIQDYRSCTPWSGYGWNQLTTNEEIRHAVWPGQSPTGKKEAAVLAQANQKPPFPFDGASDTRIFMADEIINENVALLVVAFLRAAAGQKMSLSVERGYSLKLLDHYIGEVMSDTLPEQVELSAQYRGTYGLFYLNARWVREVRLERQKVKLEELLLAFQALAQMQAGFPTPEEFMGMLRDPDQDGETVKVLAALHEITADRRMEGYGYDQVELPELSTKTLRQAARELRENRIANVPMPCLCRNEPEIVALKPWDEVLISGALADLKRGRVYLREFLDEVTLRRRIVERGWSPDWVAEALKHKGKISAWGQLRTGNGAQPPSWDPARFQDTTFTMQETKNELVEVVYATYWALDSDSVPCVQCTVFHPEVGATADGKELYAEHGMLEEGFIPFVCGRREVRSPQLTSSRGIPEIAVGWQREKKVTRDGGIDLLSISVMPPINKYASSLGVKYKFGPGVENTVQAGREPKFMEVPTRGVPLAYEMVDRIDRDANRYFGRLSADVPPLLTQLIQQWQASGFLAAWTNVFQMVLELARCNMPDAQFAEVTGAPAGWLDQNRERKGLFKALLHIDVRELDPEFVWRQIELINTQVLPGDVGGVIDRNMLIKTILHTINPRLARDLIRDDASASQEMFDAVNNDVALMFLGNLPHLVENDPTAKSKLQFATQIVQNNPKYQAELMNPESRFAQLMGMYSKNLGFSMQQQQNKQIGRVGVDPNQLQEMN